MTGDASSQTLINKDTGEMAVQLKAIDPTNQYDEVQRLNYYTVLWVQKGSGRYQADISEYAFEPGTIFFFTPYQPFRFMHAEQVSGLVLHFHPDFFCIEKHKKEVSCNGVLFNNVYQPPTIKVSDKDALALADMLEKFKTEMSSDAIARYDLLVSYLKIFLITASRIKIEQHPELMEQNSPAGEPFILLNLKTLIEKHYRDKHTPAEFAALLFISPKALGKLTKTHFNKTPTDLIQERIIIEAKRELYLTDKPIKRIAAELGYDDEFYFSRLFKNKTNASPQLYREKVGYNRAGNLSMS